MPKGRTCGSCIYFIRIRTWGKRRNGLCDYDDFNCHADSAYAKKCKHYKKKKYKRENKWNQ